MKINKKQNKAFSLIELSVVILIIGILVIGISQGSRIITESRIKSAQSLTQSSPVSSINGLALWLETSYGTNISSATESTDAYGNIENEDLVNKWKSRNPHKTNPIIVSAAANDNRPTYIANGIGGIPTLDFDGSDDTLEAAIGPINKGNKAFTIAIVAQKESSGAKGHVFSQFSSSAGFGTNDHIGVAYHDTTGIYPLIYNRGYSAKEGGFLITVTKPAILIVSHKIGSTNNQLYVNGQSGNTSSYTPADTIVGNAYMNIGSTRGSSSNNTHFAGYISEIIVFNKALKSSEINDVEEYLSSKYSIALD